MRTNTIVLLGALLLSGCAGPNPNPGERTTDMAWLSGNFERAFSTVKPKAEQGQPWAQLRLGIFYENGWGVEKNTRKAVEWYKKALEQKATGDWAEGLMIGAFGRFGYFNQNSDARIAEFNLAQVYYQGDGIEKDLVQAYVHVTNVIEESKGKAIFFCCEFSGGRSFTPKQFDELRNKIRVEMSPAQIKEAEEFLSNRPGPKQQ
jgi:hypothetical protein